MPAWVPDAVFYEIVPDRLEPPRPEELAAYAREAFEPWDAAPSPRAYKGGNLRGVVRHLDRIADLGVTALYLTPVHASPTYHRYKPVDLFSVDPLLGGDSAFDALVAEARARGLRVVVDVAFNHVGVGFLPFVDIMEYGERSPYRDWFHVTGWPVRPYGEPRGFRSWNDNPSMPLLNHAAPGVRALIERAVAHWLRRGVDGLRLDGAGEFRHPELFDAIREVVDRENPEAYVLGETWTDASSGLDGRRWDGATNYPFHFGVRELAGGPHLRLEHVHPGAMRPGGIDAREYGRRIDALLARHPWWHTLRQLNFVDGHDVARFITVTGGDRASVELASLLIFTFPGAPCVYYGAEVGLEGGLPPDSRRGFPPRERWDEEALRRHRAWIALRRRHPALRTGAYRTLHAEGSLYAALRRDEHEALVVAVNAGAVRASVDLGVADLGRPVVAPRLLHGACAVTREATSGIRLELEPRSGVVVALDSREPVEVVSTPRPGAPGREVVVVGNIGVDTNVYLPAGVSGAGALESTFTDDLDVIGQAGGYSSFGFAALGRRTSFIGHVGADPLGRWIESELRDAGVEALLFTDPAGTARSVNLVAPDGTRKNFYDGKSHMTLVPDLERCRELLAGARHAHFHLPNWARRLLPLARELGLTISVDLQDTTSARDPYREDFVAAAQILFCSAVNLGPEELGAELLARNPGAIVVFGMGARGAGLQTARGFRHFPPVELEAPVVDTNGAGDSLAVGFLTAYVLERRPLEEAMLWGQLAARWACTERRKWRRLVTRATLERLLGTL